LSDKESVRNSLLNVILRHLIVYGYQISEIFIPPSTVQPELCLVFPILVLDDKVEIHASMLPLWDIHVGGLEFLEMRLYLNLLHLSSDYLWLHYLLVGADCKL
jgi:hypothetical protein